MKLSILAIATAFAALFGSSFCNAQTTITFEELPLVGSGFYNGSDGAGGWSSQGVSFRNSYDAAWGSWSGWAYSNINNTTDGSYLNQYASVTGGGANGAGGVEIGGKYAVAYSSAVIDFATPSRMQSIDLTNTTYAARTIRDGSDFSKPFGGKTGSDPDLFEVTFRGYDGIGGSGNQKWELSIPLADFRFASAADDYILDRWLTVDFSSFSDIRSVTLDFSTTDVGGVGPNTPLYLAADNLTFTAVPEPTSLALCGAIAAAGWGWRRVRKRTSTGTFSR